MQETLIKEIKRKEKHNKGITLIALVVTIIILLILAGVTIMTLLGDNGIINKTSGAKQLTEQKGVEEQILLAVAASMANDKAVVQESLLRTALENSFGTEASGGYTLTGSDSAGWTIVAKGITYMVDSHGNEIKEVPKVNPADVTPVAISKLTTNIDTTVVDTNGYTLNNTKVTDATTETAQTLWVPKDFKILTGTDSITNQSYPTTVAEGIVVEDRIGNQFVWVPVPDVIWDGTRPITLGTYTPMATTYTYENSSLAGDTNYSTLYRGILYEFDETTATSYEDDYNVGTTSYREPSLVTENSEDKWAPMTTIAGDDYDATNYANAGSFATASAFGTQMQKDYNDMISSVSTYGGFYVGRFETGYELDGSTKIPTSKPETNDNGVTTAGATDDPTEDEDYNWYGLYKMQKEFYKMQKEFATTSEKVKSSMIWGSQYDAMMNWMAKTGKTVGTNNSSNCNYHLETGSIKEDILNNVFDLYGCHHEWTLEALDTFTRVTRGGNCYCSDAPAKRLYDYPIYASSTTGSRLTLYIVE